MHPCMDRPLKKDSWLWTGVDGAEEDLAGKENMDSFCNNGLGGSGGLFSKSAAGMTNNTIMVMTIPK